MLQDVEVRVLFWAPIFKEKPCNINLLRGFLFLDPLVIPLCGRVAPLKWEAARRTLNKISIQPTTFCRCYDCFAGRGSEGIDFALIVHRLSNRPRLSGLDPQMKSKHRVAVEPSEVGSVIKH